MKWTVWSAVVALCFGLVAGCGGSEVRETNSRLVVEVEPEDSIDDVAHKAYAAVGGGRDCLLVWGDVVTQPAEARPVRLVWADFEHIDGYVLCGEDADLVVRDPRAEHLAMLYYRDRRLHVGHPSQGGTIPLRRTVLGLRSDGPAPCLSVFDRNSSDSHVPAFVVLRELREVPLDFLIAAMPVDGGAGTAGGENAAAAK